MRRLLVMLAGLVALLAMAQVAMAAGEAPQIDSYGLGLSALAAALGMAIAAAGCGIAQGMGLKSACEGVARNPDASGKITVIFILGLAFIESLAIYALVINLILMIGRPFG